MFLPNWKKHNWTWKSRTPPCCDLLAVVAIGGWPCWESFSPRRFWFPVKGCHAAPFSLAWNKMHLVTYVSLCMKTTKACGWLNLIFQAVYAWIALVELGGCFSSPCDSSVGTYEKSQLLGTHGVQAILNRCVFSHHLGAEGPSWRWRLTQFIDG